MSYAQSVMPSAFLGNSRSDRNADLALAKALALAVEACHTPRRYWSEFAARLNHASKRA